MTIDVEVWMLAVTAACAVAPWAFSIHAKVAVIANSVESLPEIVEELREALQEHEHRLDEHAKEITALKEKTRAGG
jgi:ABC-type molybdate transport system permease subunit